VSPLTIVLAMACIGSSRLCARVERLCQFGHFAQLRRKVSTTTCVKSRPVISARTAGALLQHCQVRCRGEALPAFSTPPRLSPVSNCPAFPIPARSASPRRSTIRPVRRARENALSHSIFRDFRLSCQPSGPNLRPAGDT